MSERSKPDKITIACLFSSPLQLLLIHGACYPRFAICIATFRYTWLIATGWRSSWVDQCLCMAGTNALRFTVPGLATCFRSFSQSPTFVADGIAWAFAISLTTLCLADPS